MKMKMKTITLNLNPLFPIFGQTPENVDLRRNIELSTILKNKVIRLISAQNTSTDIDVIFKMQLPFKSYVRLSAKKYGYVDYCLCRVNECRWNGHAVIVDSLTLIFTSEEFYISTKIIN